MVVLRRVMCSHTIHGASCLQKKSESGALEATKQKYDEELTCTVCLEQVVDGELVRSLPCLHQVMFLPSKCEILKLPPYWARGLV